MISGKGALIKKLSSHFADFGFWMKVLKICEKYLAISADVKSNYLSNKIKIRNKRSGVAVIFIRSTFKAWNIHT